MHLSSLYLVQGIIIGLAISLSIGPIALITIKRTAQYGFKAGIVASIAIVLIDTTVAFLVLLGIHSTHHSFYIHIPKYLKLILAFCMFIYGLTVFRKKMLPKKPDHPLEKHFSETFMICLANPSTYISFGIIALLLSRFIGISIFDRTEVLFGFLIGALIWWIGLVAFSFKHRERISVKKLQKFVGLLIMLLALVFILNPHENHYNPFIHKLINI